MNLSYYSDGGELSAAQLAGTRETLIDALSLVLGSRSAAEKKLSELETLIRQRAAEGTREALQAKMPEIQTEVRAEVKKVVRAGAAIVGGTALLVGVIALFAKRGE